MKMTCFLHGKNGTGVDGVVFAGVFGTGDVVFTD